jgi:hypothetical protein
MVISVMENISGKERRVSKCGESDGSSFWNVLSRK